MGKCADCGGELPNFRCPVASRSEQSASCEEAEPRRVSPIGRMIERILPIDEEADRMVSAALSRSASAARTSRKLYPTPRSMFDLGPWHDPVTERRLRTLARNLYDAAALCHVWSEAFDDGWKCSTARCATRWAPGCGLPMPGRAKNE